MHVDERTLADFLVDTGAASRTALADARERAAARGESLYHALLNGAYVDADRLRRAAAHTLGVSFVVLNTHDIPVDVLVRIPEPISRTHNIVAIKVENDTLEVALLDLDALQALEPLQHTLPYKIVPRFTDQGSMKRTLLKYQKHLKEKFGSFVEHGFHAVDALIKHALYSRAGGIHIEPSTAGFLIRYRVGEMLHEAMQLPEHVGSLLVEQLKSLAKLFPVSVPQEGRFTVEHEGAPHSVHVSTMPLHKGEKLHIRLRKEISGFKAGSLESLGFHGEGAETLHKALHARSGLVLVTYPESERRAGTELLYTMMSLLAYPHRALASVEDEVLRHIPHVAQASTKATKLSSAALLRTTLKHDPDVVMVSSIADSETALVAADAASQNKLVIVGVESSSSSAGVEKLLHLGVPPLLLASALRVVVGYRQLRRVCPHCKSTHRLSRAESRMLEERVDLGRVFAALKEEGVVEQGSAWKEIDFPWQEGCDKCEGGYRGFVGVGEVVPISSPLKELILRGEAASVSGGALLTTGEDALYKAARGETTTEEVLALVKHLE